MRKTNAVRMMILAASVQSAVLSAEAAEAGSIFGAGATASIKHAAVATFAMAAAGVYVFWRRHRRS